LVKTFLNIQHDRLKERKENQMTRTRNLVTTALITLILAISCLSTVALADGAPSLNKTEATVKKGKKVKMKVTGVGKKTAKKTKWTVSDKKVLSLSKKRGKAVTVKAKTSGVAVVTAKCAGQTLNCVFTVGSGKRVNGKTQAKLNAITQAKAVAVAPVTAPTATVTTSPTQADDDEDDEDDEDYTEDFTIAFDTDTIKTDHTIDTVNIAGHLVITPQRITPYAVTYTCSTPGILDMDDPYYAEILTNETGIYTITATTKGGQTATCTLEIVEPNFDDDPC